ncbi:MAG: AAA family ATPase, partial [Acetobacteraceae bacterium]|nr:AAA family ATPase [Acetobacteraceae bacterium]
DAHEQAGYRVVGLAPTNAVVQDLKADGFGEASTVHSALFGIKNGRTLGWDKSTVLIVDEAAMLDTRITGELLAEARASGAKVVLAGDDRQLASIERGGLFAELRKAHGAAEITEVTRQRTGWQRQAARDLADGRFDAAVQAFDRNGAVTWTPDQDAARSALVERWKTDSATDPHASRFVFAYTNAEVDRLNAELRQVRRDRGELESPDVVFETKHGAMAFAVSDRVQFTDTAKKLGIHNGNAGTITDIDAATGQVTARLDGPAGKEGREVTWSADEFQGFRHGYAGTIYKGQGKTLDHTYLLHTHHWRAAASYVALTRQRESAQVFVATETARDARQLARQMARGEVRAASVAWATADEVAAARPSPRQDPAERARPGQDRPEEPQEAERSAPAATTTAKPRSAASVPDTGWLIPPYVDPTGQDRDSLGRGTTREEIAAAVAADKRVQLEREARWSYLQGAYNDPHAARAALDELVKREGWTSAASRIAREPGQVGELRGKVGWLASGAAKQERARAERAAGALPGSLQRIGDAEGSAARAYSASVDAQRAADRTGVPRLSADAEAALAALRSAPDQTARAAVWQAVEKSDAIAAELGAFRGTVERRFGAEGVRQMLRTEGRAGAVSAPSVTAGQRTALDQVAERISTMWSGEKAASAAEHQAERLGLRQGPRMRM